MNNAAIEIEGRVYQGGSDRPTVNFEQVSDGFFATLGFNFTERALGDAAAFWRRRMGND